METRKKKFTKKEEELLSKFKDAQIKECCVNLVQMDIAPILLNRKPLSDKDIESILQGSDVSGSDSEHIISPRSKNRLRKKENGMVFIPRSKYNEHPAKSIISTRKSKRNAKKKIIKVKMSPKSSRSRSSSSGKSTKNNNSIYRKSSSYAKTTPNKNKNYNNNNKYSNAKTAKSPLKQVIEYHLVFSPPRSVNKRKRNSKSLKSLSDFINVNVLPSKLWEIERVPPLIPSMIEDSIAKELLALTEENKENVLEGNDKHNNKASTTQGSPKSKHVDDSSEHKEADVMDDKETSSLSKDNVQAESNCNKQESEDMVTDLDTALKDELEALLSDADVTKKTETNEEIISEKVEPDDNITSEDIEKTIKDVVMDVMDSSQNALDEIIGDDLKSENGTCTELKEEDGDKETDDDSTSKNKDVSSNPETNLSTEDATTKMKDDDDKEKKSDDVTKETVEENKQPTNEADEDSIALRRPKRSKKEKSVHFEENVIDDHSDDEKNIIKSLIFRKYSENKKAYEKVVVFRSSMDYAVTINNKPVELIGAPEEMTSSEDLQILLQIVDESNLDSFNVICKS